MKNISFSQKFLDKHPRKGQPTYFVEQVLNALGVDFKSTAYSMMLCDLNERNITFGGDKFRTDLLNFRYGLNPEITDCKLHTIRDSDGFKAGEYFNPVIWSEKPYRSLQIMFAPVIPIKQVIPFDIDGGNFYLGSPMQNVDSKVELIARNEGLSEQDFKDWFKYPKPFQGNVLAWRETNY